ncbi:hypothetical protein [Xanthomarina sp.]|uniref:hypothetical protein n=1 Tax=Xanthomarina sp. TaxID=1931211 RepID=UPI002C74AFB0|nr:hypothetical protein [Xanthomarina sp.]HLV40390.1 hypothetical protein [Xanthomarina sp.]
MNKLIFFKENKIFAVIFVFAVIFILRSFILPLAGDEITYLNISNNILEGRFYQNDSPSTFTPIIPFILTFFQVLSFPELGFALNKVFNASLFLIGLYFGYLFFRENKIDHKVSISIISVTLVTQVVISFIPTLYPDALLFFCFWGFLYYSTKEANISNFRKMIFLFTVLTLTRHVYAVLGVVVLINLYKLYTYKKLDLKKALFYCFACLTPFIVWFKYVYHIESNNLSNLTYFSRFKEESSLFYNIKAGLGLIQHQEVSRINGIPAFISVFIPITGIRNFVLSVVLISAFIYGYINRKSNTEGVKILFLSICLVMLGFVAAGTGFSRYWVPLIPGFYLGYYFLTQKFKVKNIYFINLLYVMAFIYILNELRISLIIFEKYL